jgi:hypothetical protein
VPGELRSEGMIALFVNYTSSSADRHLYRH